MPSPHWNGGASLSAFGFGEHVGAATVVEVLVVVVVAIVFVIVTVIVTGAAVEVDVVATVGVTVLHAQIRNSRRCYMTNLLPCGRLSDARSHSRRHCGGCSWCSRGSRRGWRFETGADSADERRCLRLKALEFRRARVATSFAMPVAFVDRGLVASNSRGDRRCVLSRLSA